MLNISRLDFNHKDDRVVAQFALGTYIMAKLLEMLNRHAQVGASVPMLVISVGDMLSMGFV